MINSKKGFTMVELMIVVAIMAILSAVIVPNIAGRSENDAVKQIQSEVPIFLANLFEKSNAEGIEYYLTLDLTNNIIKIFSDNGRTTLIDDYDLSNKLKYVIVDDVGVKSFSLDFLSSQKGVTGTNFNLYGFSKKIDTANITDAPKLKISVAGMSVVKRTEMKVYSSKNGLDSSNFYQNDNYWNEIEKR